MYSRKFPAGQQNPLLAKVEVGIAKAPTIPIPGADHIYGRPSPSERETVAQAMTQGDMPKVTTEQKTPNGKDFISMNRDSVKTGVASPRSATKFRKEYSPKPRPVVVQQPKPNSHLPSEKDPDFVYGDRTKNPTPIGDVLSFTYQKQFEEDQKKRLESIEKSLIEKQEKNARRFKVVIPEKKKQNNHREELVSNFRMKKFADVPPRIQISPKKVGISVAAR
eukprot:TRINITY_DN3036_c0_g1_i1.p2 TRINITY_DN3036_c0_g1~~TRINITY_DN3036_c0_g1_i1.p2  ORF type:complete len:221 (+),score=44.21 TRINITY_DN3036_c0_g1_i1:57-719(+)